MKRLPHDSLPLDRSFRKKSLSLLFSKCVSLSLLGWRDWAIIETGSGVYSARALAPVMPDSSFFTVGRILATVVDSIWPAKGRR